MAAMALREWELELELERGLASERRGGQCGAEHVNAH